MEVCRSVCCVSDISNHVVSTVLVAGVGTHSWIDPLVVRMAHRSSGRTTGHRIHDGRLPLLVTCERACGMGQRAPLRRHLVWLTIRCYGTQERESKEPERRAAIASADAARGSARTEVRTLVYVLCDIIEPCI